MQFKSLCKSRNFFLFVFLLFNSLYALAYNANTKSRRIQITSLDSANIQLLYIERDVYNNAGVYTVTERVHNLNTYTKSECRLSLDTITDIISVYVSGDVLLAYAQGSLNTTNDTVSVTAAAAYSAFQPLIVSPVGGGGGTGTVETIVAGTGISVDDTDPANPIVTNTGGAGAYLPLEGGTMDNGAVISMNNGAKIKEGTSDQGLGGNKGIALVCSVDYELKWEAGRLYVMEQNGFTIREVRYTHTSTPTVDDDITTGYIVGSRWVEDDGTAYVCTDNTDEAAVWSRYSTTGTYIVINTEDAAIGGLIDGAHYAVQDVESLTGAVFYSIGLPDGTLSNIGTVQWNGYTFKVDYNTSIDRCMWAESDFGWKFLYSPNATNSGALSIINDWFGITPNKDLMTGCVMGGINFTGFSFTDANNGIIRYKDFIISEISTLDLSDVGHDLTLSGKLQDGVVLVTDNIVHDHPAITFPAYFENYHGINGLCLQPQEGGVLCSMLYEGIHKVSGKEHGTCEYNPETNSIRNSALEINYEYIPLGVHIIDFTNYNFAGIVRVSAPDNNISIDEFDGLNTDQSIKIKSMADLNTIEFTNSSVTFSFIVGLSFGGIFTLVKGSYLEVRNTDIGYVVTYTDTY